MITIDAARIYYDGADTVHDFDHVLRVLALAERIARAEGADREIVHAAALLHDVARAQTAVTGGDHAAVGAERAKEILAGHPAKRVEAVAQAVAAHRYRGGPAPKTLEARVLFDADKLDAIGAIGIARAFAFGGAQNQRLWASRAAIDLARWEDEGDSPEEHTPVHEFVVKLSRIKDQLFTPTGRAIAADRHAYMTAFFDRLDAEMRGEL